MVGYSVLKLVSVLSLGLLVAVLPNGWVAHQASTDTTVLDGVYTRGQASQGQRTFEKACNACHDTGEFTGGRFRLSWVGRTVADLFESVSTLMPEGAPGSLTADEYAALVAYIFSLNGYPGGDEVLPSDSVALRNFRIVSDEA